ncbi:MAG: hypothetical protein IJQ58_08465 [Synergistaceae bacterium]|nr:hypothetical protein [Synergistaceae bacterium]
MLRRLLLILLFASVFFWCDVSEAATKTPKYNGPLLNDCRIYQLGEGEFMVRLSGKKLPAPETEAINDGIKITISPAKASKPAKIKENVLDTINGIPLIYDFTVENISEDKIFSVVIEIKANKSLEYDSMSRGYNSYQLRIKSYDPSALPPYLPPPKKANAPETNLPFRINEKITIELRDAELRDVMRGLMAHIGRNIIIDSTFPQNVLVTMTLVDVRIDDVLNYLMRTYDLAAYVAGVNTIAFGTMEGLYKLSGSRITKTFDISFAEPAQAATLLNALANLDGSSVTVDERLRKLYVSTNPAKMQEVEDIISRIDVPQKQVMIQANIFEFNDTDSLSVQNALNIAYDDIKLNLGGSTGISVQYQQDRSVKGPRTIWTDRVISDTFSALETKSKGKVIANPSVITIDGLSATINLTNDYMYASARDQAGNITYANKTVGPQLSFTPTIERDGYVRMKLNISTGDVIGTTSSGNSTNIPITSSRTVTTEIRVRDGMPFVIGGLFQDNNTRTKSKIPVLGNIPLLGDLFSYNNHNHNRTQAVIVVTPYILDSN